MRQGKLRSNVCLCRVNSTHVFPKDRMSILLKCCIGSYYLPLDNGGFAFEWMSNLQVITPVHLKPCAHVTKNRAYNLPASATDKKTVVEALNQEDVLVASRVWNFTSLEY